MSEGEGSSGEEGSLQIDTEPVRRTNSERVKGRGGRSRGKGRKGRGGAKGSGQQPDPADSFKPGDVVWAKVMGFNFWPAKVRMYWYNLLFSLHPHNYSMHAQGFLIKSVLE